MGDSTPAEEVRKRLKALDVQRQSLELESEAIVSELTTSDNPNIPPMGIDTPLVDREGYPRSDIDVYRARTLRSRLVTIRNDHKILMTQIETELGQLSILNQDDDKQKQEQSELSARSAVKPKPKFDPLTGKWVVKNWDGSIAGTGEDDKQVDRKFDELSTEIPKHAPMMTLLPSTIASTRLDSAATSTIAASAAAEDDNNETNVIHHPAAMSTTPLARVNAVESGSPADEAGLFVHDRILSFGPIHGTMDGIGELVQQAAAAHQRIGLRVHRGEGVCSNIVLLVLSPRLWSGKGLLGCHIVPVS